MANALADCLKQSSDEMYRTVSDFDMSQARRSRRKSDKHKSVFSAFRINLRVEIASRNESKSDKQTRYNAAHRI